MAEISVRQVIHNVKEKYIEATENADVITYGNIADKVYDAITQNKGLPVSTYTLSPLSVGFSVQSTSTFTVKEEA